MTRSLRRVFLWLAALLYAWFMLLDLTARGNSVPVKFAAILLCLLAALGSLRTVDGRLTALALALTVGADWFLLVLDRHYLAGVLLFCAVQLVYLCRLACLRGRLVRPLLAVRSLPLALLPLGADALSSAAAFYFTGLVCNAAEAFSLRRQSRRAAVFALGLALFICCDLCVGAWNIGLQNSFTRVAMWLFYLPSQVLIVLSAQIGEKI